MYGYRSKIHVVGVRINTAQGLSDQHTYMYLTSLTYTLCNLI